MSHERRSHIPVSTRHAFALAFDLAVRRDAVHSLLVPLLLRAPWILALGLLPPISQSESPGQVLFLTAAALLGDFLTLLAVGAMLRFRARSVFNTPAGTAAAPIDECYAKGLARVPWLLVTEVVRNVAIVFATFFFVLPALFLSFRLSLATEAVVLGEPDTAGAFQRSFRLTRGRFERWLEMVVVSVVVIVAILFLVAALSVIFSGPAINTWVAAARLLITAITPVIQYAWTFFYLRLIEGELDVPGVEVGPAYAESAPAPVEAAPPPAEAWPAPTSESPSEVLVVHSQGQERPESETRSG